MFDAVFSRLQDLLNSLVDLNNGINEAVAEVKVAYAVATKAMELHTTVGPNCHVVLLDLVVSKGSNVRPQPETIKSWLEEPEIKSADIELELARVALHMHLANSATDIAIKVNKEGVLEAQNGDASGQLQYFNNSFSRFKTLLGSRAHLNLTVKHAAAFGRPTVKAALLRSVGEAEPSPVPLLEICSSAFGSNLKEAEQFVVERANQLAHRTRALELEWQVEAGYRVSVTTEISNVEVRNKVAEQLHSINIALFKMMNSGASAYEPASLANVVVEVIKPMLLLLKEHHQASEQDLKSLISVEPVMEFRRDDDGSPPIFDFHLDVDLSRDSGIPPFPECLPEKASQLLAALDNLKDVIAEALNDLPPISEEVDSSLEDAKEFYELCPDAAAKKGLSMMEAVKCSKATGTNLRTLYSTQELFLAFGENVKRVADELTESSKEVEKLLDMIL
ncbi:hypothetical protein CEUSTIGMA_g1397.t1 [Chlamydomonas eustigma]|uniref:Uncharacterized protein n=1 Tax=Chlamydomonas eustigma TaxID=1157962 RepID=A0A250WSY0_9CHLO|nr:hypothetical protein CEUSTIGMA_g1397.t1 [Chlamydomonas eustigma]|eukprot:GAX73947.1 hypothetical protein CEUSTIGMA_g1397.t1 [Chlamydomonas eustigma]